MTAASSNTPQPQQLLQQRQCNSPITITRPHSSAAESVVEGSHPSYHIRRGSENNALGVGLMDDISSSLCQTQRPIFTPRGFASPPPPPRYPPFASPPPLPQQRHVPPPAPWSIGSMSTFVRPTLQESAPGATPPIAPGFSPATLLEKLSCFIDHPDLILPMLQAVMQQEGHQHQSQQVQQLDAEMLASIVKMFHQYSSAAASGDAVLSQQAQPPSTANSTSSPSHTTSASSAASGGGGGQYHHLSRGSNASTPPPPPPSVSRTGSMDQVRFLVFVNLFLFYEAYSQIGR